MSNYKRLTTTMVVNGKNIRTVKGKVTIYDLIDRLCDLEDKIENGTLIELPYKLGTKLYFIVLHTFGGYFEIFETELWVYVSRYKDEFGGVDFAIEINDVDFDYETWVTAHCYSTKAEAEAKLKELQEYEK